MYKPFTLALSENTITMKSGDESITRSYTSPNTAASRFGELRKQMIEQLVILAGGGWCSDNNDHHTCCFDRGGS